MSKEMNHRTWFNKLYDTYGELLTENQQMTFELYYEEDYSLAEISEITLTSRQAVHNTLIRTVASLERYEDILKYVSKNEKWDDWLNRIKIIFSSCQNENNPIKSDIERLLIEANQIRRE